MSELDNLTATLSGYKFQLQQVEAALIIDPDNEELIQLKKDLVQVIKLTEELIENEKNSLNKLQPVSDSHQKITEEEDFSEDVLLSSRPWQVGDVCLAPWSSDNWYEILNNSSRPGRIVGMEVERGFCTVYFEAYDHSETVEIANLRRPPLSISSGKTKARARNKAELEKMKQRKHKKVDKKKARFQEMEKAHEEDKQKWQSFFNSSSKHKFKGLAKKRPSELSAIESGRVGGDLSGSLVTKQTFRPTNPSKQ